ncbi:DUF6247 family protein [Actinomadura harenae]|uniref:Uncharacterized protein n=1 Tax=Actinomadura harenae TaxID=2483351 RepID=A0A3M2M103_9ACTN|nr:DUF6247 family protein [Actinomadura harenae]RMI43311.1 hypothetical protein EBO15_16660 [Actinomadura harenae]
MTAPHFESPAGPGRPYGNDAARRLHDRLPADDRALFEAEFRAALEAAKETFDLTGVQRVLERWRRYLVVHADARAGEGLEAATRAAAGESVPVVPVDWTLFA